MRDSKLVNGTQMILGFAFCQAVLFFSAGVRVAAHTILGRPRLVQVPHDQLAVSCTGQYFVVEYCCNENWAVVQIV